MRISTNTSEVKPLRGILTAVVSCLSTNTSTMEAQAPKGILTAMVSCTGAMI